MRSANAKAGGATVKLLVVILFVYPKKGFTFSAELKAYEKTYTLYCPFCFFIFGKVAMGNHTRCQFRILFAAELPGLYER